MLSQQSTTISYKWNKIKLLLGIVTFFYFSFIILIGFHPGFLLSFVPKTHITFAILWGAGLIFLSIAINAYYVFIISQKNAQ